MDPFLPYFAGFFDGEGSIGIYRNGSGKGRTLRVQLTQNATPQSALLLHECRARWGGSICLMNRHAKRPAWNWQASAGRGAAVLQDLQPHLRLKRSEADIALSYWSARAQVQRDVDGRFVAFTEAENEVGRVAESALKAAKRATSAAPERLMADAADLVEVRHTLRQIVNVKGD
jgi:hypothetical protein